MANNINFGKIYDSTWWGVGVTSNNINWGKSYLDLAGGGGFDADYQAVLDYATAQGYTLPSSGQQTLQNQLVVDLKDGGIWSKLDTFAVFATDGDSDFALIDWKRLTDYTAVNSPAFTSNQGFQGNATSSYINTNFNLDVNKVNYALNSASIGVYDLNNQSGNFIFGAAESVTIRTSGNWNSTTNKFTRINDGSSGFPSTNITNNGFVMVNRTSSSNLQIYDNGILHQQSTITSNDTPNQNLFLMAFNNEGSAILHSNSKLSIAFVGSDLSAEVSSINTAFNTYISVL